MKIIFIYLAILLPACAFANSSAPLYLRYEPVQPLLQPENLDPQKVTLGEKLFNETSLSRDNNMSCASCHILNENGADHKALAAGRNNTTLNANTLTVFNSSLNHRQFWDGRAATLEQQIDFVLTNNKEFASNWNQAINKLKKNKTYPKQFKKIYADGITADNIRNAIATFEKSLITTNSRFDQYLLGDVNAISAQEKNGYRLFKSYGCVACHQGSNVGGNMFMKFGVFGNFYAEKNQPSKPQNLGRYNISGNENDRYVFRVPSLRLAVLSAPYFHDGSVDTLQEAIKIMAKHQLGRAISEQHVNDIIAFLSTLPGDYQGQSLYEKEQRRLKAAQ
ncbi:Cytochrome c551 peroxidase [hydrothermal vent metagenome]|uniref:Cytochrome c551 peroxidase n=1 Tax=hydrothermal vent metagenome TaxID=652676 RepID=A0A3B0WZZ9_9ZZZZ